MAEVSKQLLSGLPGVEKAGVDKANDIISNIRLLVQELNQAGIQLPGARIPAPQIAAPQIPAPQIAAPQIAAPIPGAAKLIDGLILLVGQLEAAGLGDDHIIRALLRQEITVTEVKGALELIRAGL